MGASHCGGIWYAMAFVTREVLSTQNSGRRKNRQTKTKSTWVTSSLDDLFHLFSTIRVHSLIHFLREAMFLSVAVIGSITYRSLRISMERYPS